MKLTDLRIRIMAKSDKADPLNFGCVAAARAFVDGKPCAWRGDSTFAEMKHNEQSVEVAVGRLILHMLREPNNVLPSGETPQPQTPIEIPQFEEASEEKPRSWSV